MVLLKVMPRDDATETHLIPEMDGGRGDGMEEG